MPQHCGKWYTSCRSLLVEGEGTGAMLHLDGRSFSGSGTIVRFGVPLAALAGQDLHLTHIRARRDPPGLRPQHLTAVEAVTQVCQGALEGGTVGSQELLFHPGRLPQGGICSGTSVPPAPPPCWL